MLFHLDEFQAPLQHWLSGKDSQVSIVGLQSMLEGISTPNNVVFIFTSSMELPRLADVVDASLRHELQGLLRRFQCVVKIPALDKATAESFLTGFLKGYVEVEDWEVLRTGQAWQAFAAAWCHWEPEVGVLFDMLSKYAEHAVRDFYVDGGWLIGRRGSSGKIGRGARLAQDSANASHMQDAFLRTVINPKAVSRFFEEYAGGSHFPKLQHAHHETSEGEGAAYDRSICRQRRPHRLSG